MCAMVLSILPSDELTIAAYERELFSRGKRAVEESVQACKLLHLRQPLARSLRDVALNFAAWLKLGREPADTSGAARICH